MSRYVHATRAGTAHRKRMLSGEVPSGTRALFMYNKTTLESEL